MNVQDQPHVKMTERRSLASIRRPTQDGPVSERRADAPAPYQGFDGTIHQRLVASRKARWCANRHGEYTFGTQPAKATLSKNVNSLSRCQSVRKASGCSCCRIGAALGRACDRCARGLRRREVGSAVEKSWAIGERAFQAVIAHEKRLRAEAEAVAAHVSEHFQALCTRWNVAGELRRIDSDQPTQEAILNALHSDLVIVGHPEPNGLPDDLMLETILLASGVSLLVLPNAWLGEAIGNNVLIGWNASRKARRAISDAMPFLVDARPVATLVVDPSRGRRHGEEPGADIALQLARHNVHLNVERVMSNGSPIAEVILAHAVRSGSDLLVFGAYGHSRLRELLLGGTTRTLLAQMPVPVFVSI